MKYTNIKKLLIKFMGGGLINCPTRFLRWIKIDGDAEGDDGGGSSDSSNDFDIDRFKEAFIDINNYAGEFSYQNLTANKIKIPDAFVKYSYDDNAVIFEDTDIYEYLAAYTLSHNDFYIIPLYKIEDEFDNDDIIFSSTASYTNENVSFINFDDFVEGFDEIVYNGELNLSDYKLSFGG